MALRQALQGARNDVSVLWRKTFEGSMVSLRKIAIGFAGLIGLLSIPQLIWPERDVKMLSVQTSVSAGHLILNYFELENGSHFNLKDPEIACEMKGPSGTTIKRESRIIYEALESEKRRSFAFIDMGLVAEQVTQFNCFVKNAAIRW
jgi:hypothetical protein